MNIPCQPIKLESNLDKQQIKECLDSITQILGDNLLGVYLYGSALVGGLQKYSDIDLFVVTQNATTLSEKNELTRQLLEISGLYMKSTRRPIELTVVEKGAVNPWNYPPCFDFQYGEWLRTSFEMGEIEPQHHKMPDLALIITQVLLKSQILFGEPPEKILAPVPCSDFIKAMLQDLDKLATDIHDDTRNVLLTLARIWSTLETNTIYSKPEAADWVIERLPATYQAVMNRAKSICIGDEDEYWEDIAASLGPCTDWMLKKINAIKSSINPKKITYKMNMSQLNELSKKINNLYGFVQIAGDNFGEPAINSGPCAPFANTFYKIWNQKFTQKVHIVFIMVKNSDECWHVLIRLPNGLLFDGGFGVHADDKWDKEQFDIVDMLQYDLKLLERHSGGLDRKYPRYCPNFSIEEVTDLITHYINLIEK